jgi:hypothetical protein
MSPNFKLSITQIKLIIDDDDTRSRFLEYLELPLGNNLEKAAELALTNSPHTIKRCPINDDENFDIVITGIDDVYAVWSDATDWIGAFETLGEAEEFITNNLLQKMKSNTLLNQDLISAYEVTNFHVKAEPAFTLNVGKGSEELKTLFKQNNVTNAAFITAWNPYSKSLSDEENQARNDQLKNELFIRSLKFVNGFGQDPLGQWSGEDSFLVFGIDLEASKALGIQFEQNAIVWSDIDAIPQLILLQ